MRYTKRGFWLATVLAMLVALMPLPAMAQEACGPDESEVEEEELDNGVTLAWIGSHWCLEAPGEGEFTATLVITVEGGTIEFADDPLWHRGNTPRPGGQEPETPSRDDITITDVSVTNGEVSVTIQAPYELVQTDEGPKLNVHLSALGTATADGDPEEDGTDPFKLGFNIHLRAADTEEGDDNGNGNGSAAAENGTSVASSVVPASNGENDDDNGNSIENGTVSTAAQTHSAVNLVFSVNDSDDSLGTMVTLGTNEDGQLIIMVKLPGGVAIV